MICGYGLGNEIGRAAMPLTPVTDHGVSGSGDTDPLSVQATPAGPLCLNIGSAGVGPGVGGAVQHQEPGADRDQVTLVPGPPRRQRYHSRDATLGGQLRSHPSTHRMTNQHNTFRLPPAVTATQHRLGVEHRIALRAIPPPQPVPNAPHNDIGTEPAPQSTCDEHHPQVRRLPPARRLGTAHLAAGQDEHAGAHLSYVCS